MSLAVRKEGVDVRQVGSARREGIDKVLEGVQVHAGTRAGEKAVGRAERTAEAARVSVGVAETSPSPTTVRPGQVSGAIAWDRLTHRDGQRAHQAHKKRFALDVAPSPSPGPSPGTGPGRGPSSGPSPGPGPSPRSKARAPPEWPAPQQKVR